jgi:DNA-binding HxlR family transcriptional regulator
MSSSVLYDRLHELGASGLVARTEDDEYVLSETGASLGVALRPLGAWAETWAASLAPSGSGGTGERPT